MGPCLCGDPYCPSCGDPGAAALEEWALAFTDKLIELGIADDEARFIDAAIPALLEAYRANVGVRVSEDYGVES